MRKENLKRKGVDDGAENGSDNEEQEDSPVAAAADKAEEDAEKQTANENTEENGDQKVPDTDGDFEDAETGDDTADEKKSKAKDKESAKEKENGNGGDEKEDGEGDDDKAEGGEDDDVPLKKNGRAKPKPAKKGAKEATNGDSKENGDGKDGEEGEGEKADGDEAEDAEEADAGDDKEDADSEAGSKKAKKGKPAGPKKDAKKTKPGPAKNAKKEKAENDDEEEKEEEEKEEVEYEVQDIVDHRKQKGKMVYRIRWKNFKAKDDTWEPEATLSCPDIIKRYKAKLKKLEKVAREAEEEEEEAEVEYEVQDIVDHRKERGKMVYRIRWKNFGAKDDTWEPESTLSCPDIIKRYKAKLAKEEEEDEEEQEYEVQEIIDHRKERGKMVYRIRWKNFGPKDDTWEPESTLSCPDIIKRYKAKIAKDEEEDEEEEEYEVQEIIDHRKEKGKMVYRIRWKNFGPKDDTWEPESTLSCPDIIKRYKAKIEKEESAPPAKKYKPGPNLAALKKPGPNLAALKKGKGKGKAQPPPKKRASRRDSSEDDDDESEDETQYEVEKIIEVHFKRNGQREYLVRWKGFSAKDDTWEPEDNLSCKDLIAKFNEKLDKSKNAGVKELRVNRKQPDRLALVERGHKTSRRNAGKVRVNYYDGE